VHLKRLQQALARDPLSILLLALPVTLTAQFMGWPPVAIFVLAAIGIIPLASFIGRATEDLATHTGPQLGALLNATLGNAAELIITIAAVQTGLLELVKASITGSIIGNLLLVLGFAMVVGGVRHGAQTFNKTNASRNAILLVLAVIALVIPSVFSVSMGVAAPQTVSEAGHSPVEALSLGVAVVMLALYALGLFDASRPRGDRGAPESPISVTLPRSEAPRWKIGQSIAILALATLGVVWLSESLVHVAEEVIASVGISEFFLGIILVPLIGNVAEHLVSVQLAARNKMDLSTEIAISSSLQIALFVAPLLVFISLLLGHPLQLIFNQFELLALLAAVGITVMVSNDGESTWLEGAGLLAIYLILGLAFFFLP
jgi:Ca2+:H+ antiporter